ncbi:hypothetical protein VNI00_017661 [Paramarasmius palmivorus]|uniref:Uncharacterized protein n=1 Tax=Paramarasmius palmivorus TaxID=297713 RepID=A0AAW0B3S3_9AGAR
MSGITITVRERKMMLNVFCPVVQEFFNRVVESYPRTPQGLLGSIVGCFDARSRQLEMILVRTFADYPIHVQRCFPDKAILSLRFRNNVDLVLSTLNSLVADSFTSTVLTCFMACPPALHGEVRDLSCVPTSQLWALMVARLESNLMWPDQSGMACVPGYFERCALEWLCTGLAGIFQIVVPSRSDLYVQAESLADVLL